MSHVDFEQNTKVTMNEDKSSSSLAWYQDTSYKRHFFYCDSTYQRGKVTSYRVDIGKYTKMTPKHLISSLVYAGILKIYKKWLSNSRSVSEGKSYCYFVQWNIKLAYSLYVHTWINTNRVLSNYLSVKTIRGAVFQDCATNAPFNIWRKILFWLKCFRKRYFLKNKFN